MPNYSNVGRMSARVNNFNRRNNIIKKNPKQVLNRIIVIIDSMFDINATNYARLLINSNSVISDIDIYNGPSKEITLENIKINSLSDLLQFFYNKGYRMFIITNTSDATYSAFNWIKTHDVVVFNPLSTVATSDFLNNIPINLIRTAVNDLDMLKYLFTKIIKDFANYTNASDDKSLFLPLSNSKDIFPFSTIVYIYEPSFYTNGYLDNINKIVKTVKIVPIQLENGILPDLAKYYLTFNNISNPNYINSVDKPLIIFNSDNPDSLFKYLDDPRYYDNYTFFGDFFTGKTFITKYAFKAAFVAVANFSTIGYRLSYLVDKEQNVNQFVLNIYNIITQAASIFMSVIKKNKNTFNYLEFINLLNKLFITSNGVWAEKYVTTYRFISSILPGSQMFKNKLDKFIFFHNYNPSSIIVYSSSSSILNYNHLDIEGELSTYLENNQRIETVKPNIDNLLDNILEYYLSESNVSIYMDFLKDNYKNELSTHMFTQNYIYTSTINYKIPIIFPNPIVISKTISKNNYVLPENEINSVLQIPIQIPSIVYDTKVYYYDTITEGLIDILTDNYLEERYDDIDFTIEDSSPSIILHLYKGHLFNIGTYNENTNTFTTTEKIRGYVLQVININWLIIETEYVIGDNIIVKDSLKTGKVTGVSDDKYIITALIDGDVTETTYNQLQISKIVDI
jgi:hypothetical protein